MFEPIKLNTPGQADATATTLQISANEAMTPIYEPSILGALNVLEKALVNLGMAGRERVAPMFESFARSPGTVIKTDIAMLLENPDHSKSHASYTPAHIHKTG